MQHPPRAQLERAAAEMSEARSAQVGAALPLTGDPHERRAMIERQTAYLVIVRCDMCANNFSGGYNEPLDDVVSLAREHGWEVSGAPGRTLCGQCIVACSAAPPSGETPTPREDLET